MAYNIMAQKLGSSSRMPPAGDWKPNFSAEKVISKPIVEIMLLSFVLDRLLP
jgi:hypothetical protein